MLTNYLKARTLNETTENGGSSDFCKSNEITDDHSWVSSIERRLNAIKTKLNSAPNREKKQSSKEKPPKNENHSSFILLALIHPDLWCWFIMRGI